MGDLARGRTVRSLSYLLTLYPGVRQYFVAPDSLQIGEDIVKVSTHPTSEIEPGLDVWLRFPAGKIRWADRETGRVLYA